MHRNVLRSATLALALLATASVSADSPLSLSGLVAGRELCPQAVCGAAIFVAGFAGEIADRPAVGVAVGGIVHDPLPEIGECANILGGRWSIRTLRRTLEGDVTGGSLYNLDGTRYLVAMRMKITDGGSVEATFKAVLDHGPFPPTIQGLIAQP
jgi:hypothetical protein